MDNYIKDDGVAEGGGGNNLFSVDEVVVRVHRG